MYWVCLTNKSAKGSGQFAQYKTAMDHFDYSNNYEVEFCMIHIIGNHNTHTYILKFGNIHLSMVTKHVSYNIQFRVTTNDLKLNGASTNILP